MKCHLALGRERILVAHGTALPSLPTDVCHGVQLGWVHMKVSVEEVIRPHAPLPIPTFNFRHVGEVTGAVIVWPINLLIFSDSVV